MFRENQQHWVVAINQLAFLIDPTKLQTAADKHKLMQNCITRCGSALSMIERCCTYDCTLISTADELTVLEELASVLNLIKRLSSY